MPAGFGFELKPVSGEIGFRNRLLPMRAAGNGSLDCASASWNLKVPDTNRHNGDNMQTDIEVLETRETPYGILWGWR